MIRRLRIKFVCINMLIVTLMLCAIFCTVLYFTKENLEEESIGMMQAIALDPMRLNQPGDRGSGVRLPYFALQVGPRGELMAAGGGYYDLSDQKFLLQLVAQSNADGRQTGVLADYGLRFYRAVTPTTQCIVFADISSEINTMDHLMTYSLLIGAGSFLLFLAISLFLANWAVKPVDLAWQQQRQFVADASHELKTPLTVIQTSAELLRETGADTVSRSRFTENILVMTHQMRELVEGLLELARVDNGLTAKAFSTVDWSKTVSDTLLPFEPVFFEQGLGLKNDVEAGLMVQGSGEHLRQVLEILLDNARKYSAQGSLVELRLERCGHRSCLLTLRSPGKPLPPEELRNIFKRFYRADTARSRDGSYGLGLSIAEGIVGAHHGKIWAEGREGANWFFVRLPLTGGKRPREAQ